jgi:cyclic beta-1,2-glucan synthetase
MPPQGSACRRACAEPNHRADSTRRPFPAATMNLIALPNGLGGFTADGREYVITLKPGETTPAPWVNVLANPHFGTVVSESRQRLHLGRERPRVPPHAVGQRPGERRERRSALPARRGPASLVAHAAAGPRPDALRGPPRLRLQRLRDPGGRHHSELWVYVATDAPVKFSVLKLRNHSGRPRRLSATGYVEWVLGDLRGKSAMHVTTEIDPPAARSSPATLQHRVR